ncbi:MAG TPA: sigma-70 family RNA polymerase sigma factor [Bacteriovoracaceae bacterium]|nr:sigma-70 family RNA polymerase sigma factor [Bacteriovoracaceae bacterium]
MTDEQLMLAYSAGDEGAFNALYEKYTPKVYGYINKRLRTSEAEDLFQKVWRHLHEKRHLYQQQPFAPWFFVLIRHLLIDEYRMLGRRNTQQFKDILAEQSRVETTAAVDVEELLSTLPPESAELVKTYYLDGLSYENLEKDTGLSQTTLRQRLSRAMKKLRALQGKHDE